VRGLPARLDQLAGLRAARWTRESTKGQEDRFGPEAQRDQQDRAISRYGLADGTVADPTLHFRLAHSGRTIADTPEFGQMLARAGTDFDVLVVGYVSRFARDARTALNARHDLHAAGAAVLFADEELLTSDEDRWGDWFRHTGEAEEYSRKLAKRVKEGYAVKRRFHGVPGGRRPPLGYRRERSDPANLRSRQVLVEDSAALALVHRCFELSAQGLTDRQVATETGLRVTHLRELLTNRFYLGELQDGSAASVTPAINGELWDRVQVVRGQFARRHRGPVRYRPYVLSSLLHCASCGRRLTGHTGRYRHVDACLPFRAARPKVRETYGHSYKAEVYEDLVPQILARVSVDAELIADTLPLAVATEGPDPFTLARIQRDRESALVRYAADRDSLALDTTFARLDAEEKEARSRQGEVPTAQQTLGWLHDLPALWRAAEPSGRRLLAEAVFERIDVLGISAAEITPTPEADARGWSEAFGEPVVLTVKVKTGRGERTRPDKPETSLWAQHFRPPAAVERATAGHRGRLAAGCPIRRLPQVTVEDRLTAAPGKSPRSRANSVLVCRSGVQTEAGPHVYLRRGGGG
jgi:DNA invertase Pin-like site-specific DNA recombinase